MLKLHPVPDVIHFCPHDNTRLEPIGWYIPGMRSLAELRCPRCHREFYGDLLSGHALYTPLLVDKSTGMLHDPYGIDWFAAWFQQSFANRTNEPLGFVIEEFSPVHKPILLNCLDGLYGHCLLKLLNAQFYLDHVLGFDLVVLVPKFLRWMVPDGVAAVWTVDLPLKRGIEWNDWLAAELHKRLEKFDDCWLSVAYSHPHPTQFSIERFTRITPFPIDDWTERLDAPAVTFVWREDRSWTGFDRVPECQRVARKLGVLRNFQNRAVAALASRLRGIFPRLDFCVVGLGQPGGMPSWISDLRTTTVDDEIERQWCECYARSHIVVGVHGSNMLLPSAHAGATVELMPIGRWGNMVQDILVPDGDCRETLFRVQIVPVSVSISELTVIIQSMLRVLCTFVPTCITQVSLDHNPHQIRLLASERAAASKKYSEAIAK